MLIITKGYFVYQLDWMKKNFGKKFIIDELDLGMRYIEYYLELELKK